MMKYKSYCEPEVAMRILILNKDKEIKIRSNFWYGHIYSCLGYLNPYILLGIALQDNTCYFW